jgi:hypothetical protein
MSNQVMGLFLWWWVGSLLNDGLHLVSDHDKNLATSSKTSSY